MIFSEQPAKEIQNLNRPLTVESPEYGSEILMKKIAR